MRRWVLALLAITAFAADAGATPQYDVIAALGNLRAGRVEDALALLTRAIDSKALSGAPLADALEWRAFLHAQRQDLARARADLDAAVRADRDNPLRYRARARLLIRLGDFRAALNDMNSVMSASPSDAENYTDACETLIGLARRDEAIEQCRRALLVDPEYGRAKEMLRRAESQ